jgi:catechol 2,3-dioxygenase-like lactoylglutathione lyase family enzyme
MQNLKFVHTGISVYDLDRSVAWYTKKLGFQEIKRFEKPDLEIKGAALKCGDCILEILQPDTPQLILGGENTLAGSLRKTGNNHFAISVDDAKSLFSEFKEKEINLVSDLQDNKFFFCRDPDGTLIEVKQA